MMSAAEFYSKESLIRGQLSIFSYRRISSNTAAVQSDNDVDGSVIVATIQITVVVVQCLKENNKNYLSSDSPAAIKVGRNLNKFFS